VPGLCYAAPAMMLETERLVLREYADEDVPAVLAYYADERYWRFYNEEERAGDAGAREMVSLFQGWQRESPRTHYQLAVTLKQSGALIGSCGLRVRRLVDHGSPKAGFEADIGYEIAPALWGHGYATEAARGIVRFGFEELKLHRVWSYCLADNIASWRVMEKVGLQLEGRLRENHWMKDRWWDSLVYGLLEQEWRQRIAGA
jgi:[ribosomal protein S5]-alanine N-acetyltransferase